jgi:cysteine synthase A
MKANNILETIGNTSHLKINRLFPQEYEVWIKLERENPGGSIKDRIALNMVYDAEKKGILKPGMVIIEPTSGNTGIGLAMVAAVKGYRLILVMPESMSVERRKIMETYGADFELTPREKGMNGALARANELLKEIEGAWMPSQFENDANVDIHRKTTAREIINDFPEGIHYLITGVGTGGHITGTSEILKSEFAGMQTFAVEPAESPVISGGDPGPHGIQGIGAGFIPKVLDTSLLDGTISVTKDEAFDHLGKAAREEGLLLGISSGATLAAIARKIPELPAGSRILGFCYDSGERYLSLL